MDKDPKQENSTTESINNEFFGSSDGQSPQIKDEVDLTPEEQLTRHHVELDVEKLPTHRHHHHHSLVEQVKEKARSTIEHLPSLPQKHSNEQDRQKGQNQGEHAPFPETLQEAIANGTSGMQSPITIEKTVPGDPFEGKARSKL